MRRSRAALAVLLFASITWAQGSSTKYPWEWKNTNCTEWLSFCWYGSDLVKDPEVIAYGNRWVSQDREEKPFEWVTEVRCVQIQHLCILARSQENVFTHNTETNIDLYFVQDWSDFQIRALGESDFPHGRECEIDSLLLNRADASVSMLSVPGPAAATKDCEGIMKPKTVMYQLQLRSPQPQKKTP